MDGVKGSLGRRKEKGMEGFEHQHQHPQRHQQQKAWTVEGEGGRGLCRSYC